MYRNSNFWENIFKHFQIDLLHIGMGIFFTSQNKLLPVLEADEPSIDQMGNVHLFGHHITGEYTAEDPTGMTQCIFSHDFPFKTKRI